jgi:hypothetical protein
MADPVQEPSVSLDVTDANSASILETVASPSIMADPAQEPSASLDMAHADKVTAILNGTRGPSWIDPIHGLLSINDEPVSTPSVETAHLFQPASSESLEIAMSVNVPKDDMSLVRFSLSARGIGLEKEEVATLDTWALDIADCGSEILSDDDFTNVVKQFQPGADASV